jgi:membrane protein implicated in regulation of membrane protease activity
MGVISWVIVFIPFIFMSVVVAMLLYVFGLDPSTGKLNVQCNSSTEKKIIIHTPSTNAYVDVSYSDSPSETTIIHSAPTDASTDPQYE